jgi:hypothetical protein
MGAVGKRAGIPAQHSIARCSLVFACLVVTLCEKKVALLFELKRATFFCSWPQILVVKVIAEFITRTKMLFWSSFK